MSDIDLTGDITTAIDGAAERGSTLVLGYVDPDGTAALSFRGSTQVHSKDQLALWSRQKDGVFVESIAARPVVTLLYYSPDTPGAAYLSIKGRARVAPEADDAVYAGMIEGERGQDPDRGGVAVVIDVDSVIGAGPGGGFQQRR
jgi:hypothetical protein